MPVALLGYSAAAPPTFLGRGGKVDALGQGSCTVHLSLVQTYVGAAGKARIAAHPVGLL